MTTPAEVIAIVLGVILFVDGIRKWRKQDREWNANRK